MGINAYFSYPSFNSPSVVGPYGYTLARSYSLVQGLCLCFISYRNLSPPRINRAKERRLQVFPGFSLAARRLLSVPGPGAAVWPVAAERQRCPGNSLAGGPSSWGEQQTPTAPISSQPLAPCPLAHPRHGGRFSPLRGFGAFGVSTCCPSRPLHAAMLPAPGAEDCCGSSCWKEHSPYWAVGYLWS